MKTFLAESAGFNYNSDLSGKVIITSDEGEIEVDGKDLLEFFAEYLRNKQLQKAEEMTVKEILDKIEL